MKKLLKLSNINKRRTWKPLVSEHDIKAAEDKAFDTSKAPTTSAPAAQIKSSKLQRQQFLSKIENSAPIPGLWVQGTVLPPEAKLNYKEIEEKTRIYHALEASKIPLWTDTKENLDQFFIKECKFDSNPILKEYPAFLPRILDSLYENRKAFTTHDSHDKYREEVGDCKFFRYHPE